MNHVEMADMIFSLEEVPEERTAHLLDFVHKAAAQVVWTVVIPDAVNPLDAAAAVTRPGEDMDFMAPTFERRRQFGDMGGDSSHRVGVERFPGEHGNLHIERAALAFTSPSDRLP